MQQWLGRAIMGIALCVFCLGQATWTLAGTTGTINGTVSVPDGSPLDAARVSAISVSQTALAITDIHGHYAFLSLAPDTYTVTASKDGYESVQQPGVTVLADNTQTVNLVTRKLISTLGKITVLGTGSPLVSKSTVANVYSISDKNLTTVQSLGGGNNQENAYSAIDSTPGIFHAINNVGWGQTLFIHGGNYTQVGYEYDGVPVNRAFDQYNGDTLSSLGNQQVQIYTSGAPASASSSTVSGFINQVIKTGTYPGFATMSLAFGAPNLWNGQKLEVGGATPDRRFSYYAGISNFADNVRYFDQFNGGTGTGPFVNPSSYTTGGANAFFYGAGTLPYCAADDSYPIPNPSTDGGCFAAGIPMSLDETIGPTTAAAVTDHEGVINLHFGLPHHGGTSVDDIQALYSGSSELERFYSSTNDAGGLANLTRLTGGLLPHFLDGYTFPDGTQFGQAVTYVPGGGNNNSNLNYQRYLFPSSTPFRAFNSLVPPTQRDGEIVDDQILKLQFTHNMGDNAYLRTFVYSLYSDWLQNAPNGAIPFYIVGLGQFGSSIPGTDYELSSHTRGGELQLADQINAHNLLTFTANEATSKSLRFNNKEMFNRRSTLATVLSDANGNCYDWTTGNQTFCDDPNATGSFGNPVPSTTNPMLGAAAAAGAAWHVAFVGPSGTYNTVKPTFSSVSLSDQMKVSDRLLLNIGLRDERYHYDLASANSADNNFWFHAAAQEYCYDPATGQPVRGNPTSPLAPPPNPPVVSLVCPASPITGQPTVHPDGLNGHLLFTNQISGPIDRTEIEPRFGGTYTLNENSIIRFNYGRYAQPTPTAYTEYLYAPGAGHAAAAFNFVNFFGLGFNNPRHDINPVTSNNYDISFEQNLPKINTSFKLTPFFRKSQGELGQLLLGPNFASEFPYANQTTSGLEFQVDVGNPNRNGWAGQLAFTYTHASVKLLNGPNGTNAIDLLNSYIDAFNALTAAGNVQGLKGAPCYFISAGTSMPDTTNCTVTGNTVSVNPAGLAQNDIINPYYFTARQPDLDRNGSYVNYQNFPNTPVDNNLSNLWPYLFSGYVNYRHNKIAITPTFVLQAGDNYGGPTALIGYDPRTCTQNAFNAGIPTGNPGKANFISCGPSLVSGGLLAIPNLDTGRFDTPGQYQEPWVLNINAQISADLSPRTTARLVMSNILNTCFGGSKTPWSSAFPPGKQVCGYNSNGVAVSNFWNGTGPNDAAANVAPPIPAFSHTYQPVANPFNPFQATLQLQFKM